MKTLLEKSKINMVTLQRTMLRLTSSDVNNLSQPCYLPPHKKPYKLLLNITGLKDQDLKDFIKRTYKGTIAQNFLPVIQPDSNLLLFIMWYALKNNNKVLYHATMVYSMVRQYGHKFKKYFPQFCSPETFSYALETITKTHLFAREKTIGNSLFHLAKEMEKRYTNDIKTFNVNEIIQFIAGARHRIDQSLKSFAEHYYRAWKEGNAMKTQSDVSDEEGNMYQMQTQERGKRVIDSTVKKLTIYHEVDRRAFTDAIKITKAKQIIATLVVKELNNIKHADEIRLVLQLFVKEVSNKSMLCGKNYYPYVKKLMAVKRTRAKIYFKQQINILLLKIMKNIGLSNDFESYTTQTQYILHSFLAFYLTSVMRNTIC
jgi:hypothetical protein